MDAGLLSSYGTLSTENIMYQKNDAVVPAIKGRMAAITNIIHASDGDISHLGRRKDLRSELAKLGEVCSARFGITIAPRISHNVLAAAQPITPKVRAAMTGDMSAMSEAIKKLVKEQDPSSYSDVIDADHAVSSMLDVLKITMSGVDALDKKLKSSDVTVDLRKARVYGVPKTAVASVLFNPVDMVRKYGLTVEEMTAVYMHEVGHIFTYLEYSHRLMMQTTDFLDSLHHDLRANKSPLNAIKLSYKKSSESDKIDESTGVASACVGIMSDYLNGGNFGDNTYSNKDSERLADQFAARFGLGGSLVSALRKTPKDAPDSGREYSETTDTVLSIAAFSVIMLFLLSNAIMLFGVGGGMLAAGGVAATVSGFVTYGIYNIVSCMTNAGIDASYRYDSPKRRMVRIKREAIRQLRQEDITAPERDALLEVIDSMTGAIDHSHDSDENIIYRVAGVFFSYRDQQLAMRDIDNRVLDMLNNDVYVTAAKINRLAN